MFSSLAWSLPNTQTNVSMPNVWICSNESALYALLRHQTRWASDCGTSVMGWSTKMELVVLSWSAATNVKIHNIWNVSQKKRKKASSSPFFAPLMSVGGRDPVKWVTLAHKWVVKWVIFLLTVTKQKMTEKHVYKIC